MVGPPRDATPQRHSLTDQKPAASSQNTRPDSGTSGTYEPQREKDQRRLQDCAARRDLHSGDTTRIQHHESLAVSTAQKPGGLGQRGDHVVDELAFASRIAVLVATSMLSPLMSPTRSTIASMFGTVDAGDAKRDELLPIVGTQEPWSQRTVVDQLERGQRQLSTPESRRRAAVGGD